MGQEASDASTDRFRRGGVGGAHHGLLCARGAASRLGIAPFAASSVLLLPAFTGCVRLSESQDLMENVWPLTLLGLLVVAIGFLLLAAGVPIKIPWLDRFQPPDRAGRIFLAVFGGLLIPATLAILYYSFGRDAREQQSVNDNESVPTPPVVEEVPEIRSERLSGTVSFRAAYEDAFENYHLTLRIGSDRLSEESEATVDRDGRFTIDVPSTSRSPVTWRAVEPNEYVLWPMEIDPLAGRSGSSTSLSFEFLEIDDLFVRQKDEAIRAIQECEFERADAILNALLPVLEQLGDSVSRAQTWSHDVHRDLANEAVAHRDCADGDGGGSMSFERKWRREAIERATTLEGKILAMNTWAGLSREMYRPQELAWPDASLVDVDLISEGYRDSLREDLQLVKTELARPQTRSVVSNEIASTGIGGCLDVGQREALRTFGTLLSEPVEEINLNRLMNAISGLQRIVAPYWLLGTWIDYPDEGYGEIEIIRERVADGFEYYFRFTQHDGSRIGEGALTLEPEQSASCRFEVTDGSSDRDNRDSFVILEDGRLRNEFTNRHYPAKDASAESPGG